MKQIELSLPITVFVDGDAILVSQKRHASLIMGNTSVVGNESLFGITKRPDGYISIPISAIKKERAKFVERMNSASEKLKLIDAILAGVE